jgi:predicted transcriptional regulator
VDRPGDNNKNPPGSKPSPIDLDKERLRREKLSRINNRASTGQAFTLNDDFKILTSQEFIAGFRSPDWVVKHIFQRGYVYAITGLTGHGKTAIALLLALGIVDGGQWGGEQCKTSDIIYFAGENPDDVRNRWIAMTGGDKRFRVHFVEGTQVSLREDIDLIKAEVERLGIAPSGVIIDTKSAFFEGDAENDNVQSQNQAADLRELTTLPGNPMIIVLCHPRGNVSGPEQLRPRGGTAFEAAVDGNVTCWLEDEVIQVQSAVKFRGPPFGPLEFMLKGQKLPERYKDTDGGPIEAVVAYEATEEEIEQKQKHRDQEELRVMRVMKENPEISMNEIAVKLWEYDSGGKPKKWLAQKILKRLDKIGLVHQEGRGARKPYQLTQKGEEELKRADEN